MSNPQFSQPQHQPRGGMYDFTHKILPVVFFLHFIITGTVVLVYTLYIHEPIPGKYVIGASITFGCVMVPMIVGYIVLHGRKRYGANRRSDEEMMLSPPQSRSRSRTRRGIKRHWSRWRTFCQVYGNQQREYVREFVGKRKEKSAFRKTVVDGAIRIQSLNNRQILTFVLEKWTGNLAQSRIKGLEKGSKAPEASRFTYNASSDNQKQSRSFKTESGAQMNVRKREDQEDQNTPENPRVNLCEFHGRNQEAAPPRGLSIRSNCANNPSFTGSQTTVSVDSYQNPGVKRNNNRNERRLSVAPEDVLPRHPEPNELYTGFKQRQISQIHSATTRGRSISRTHESEGHTAGSRRGRGGSLPSLRRQKQADDRQPSFELQNTYPWTTNDPFSKQRPDFTYQLETFDNPKGQSREGQMTTLPVIAHLFPDDRDTEVLELPSNTEQAVQVVATTCTRLRNDKSSIQLCGFSNSKDKQSFRQHKAYLVDATSMKSYAQTAWPSSYSDCLENLRTADAVPKYL